MPFFTLRLLTFVGLWTLLIVKYSENAAISLLFFAAALSLYFFLSIKNVHIWIYYTLSAVIMLHALLLTEHVLVSSLILGSVVGHAAYRHKGRAFTFYVGVNALILIALSFLQDKHSIDAAVTGLFLVVMAVLLNKAVLARDKQIELYEELLSEYHRLKRLNVKADQTVRIQERTRIARDLHDSVGHKLTSLIMKLEMLAIQEKNPEYRSLKQLAEDGLKETRDAVQTLQSDEQEGLATVINLIRKLEAESHIMIQFTIKEGVLSTPLSNAKSVVLYRVLQEALTNVMRHGQTREVQMTLGKSAIDDISFEIENAHHAKKPYIPGFGLRNMKKRVEEVGGTISIYQTETKFIVSGTIPSD
ncbi:Histidine kinase [Lentibacillus sp. JNUCC-1]|uniref:sensor histidine kinase n=1 Tax=Lentibacillus sp. JNUCC-1 TaxID=2654513 RepID=UPI0012E7F34F|nr:sensor histidine kinase [Lentibacillus sp. JNUCC-1]MUV36675.1 Histidine kinase [Lentibacillus sp. JNUCC-1]